MTIVIILSILTILNHPNLYLKVVTFKYLWELFSIKMEYTTVKISQEYKDLLINDCKKLFLDENPKMKSMLLSQSFMIAKVIDYYIKN